MLTEEVTMISSLFTLRWYTSTILFPHHYSCFGSGGWDVLWVSAKMNGSLQVHRATVSNTHGCVAARKVNLMIMGLECLEPFIRKEVNQIVKAYHVIHELICTKIYSSLICTSQTSPWKFLLPTVISPQCSLHMSFDGNILSNHSLCSFHQNSLGVEASKTLISTLFMFLICCIGCRLSLAWIVCWLQNNQNPIFRAWSLCRHLGVLPCAIKGSEWFFFFNNNMHLSRGVIACLVTILLFISFFKKIELWAVSR